MDTVRRELVALRECLCSGLIDEDQYRKHSDRLLGLVGPLGAAASPMPSATPYAAGNKRLLCCEHFKPAQRAPQVGPSDAVRAGCAAWSLLGDIDGALGGTLEAMVRAERSHLSRPPSGVEPSWMENDAAIMRRVEAAAALERSGPAITGENGPARGGKRYQVSHPNTGMPSPDRNTLTFYLDCTLACCTATATCTHANAATIDLTEDWNCVSFDQSRVHGGKADGTLQYLNFQFFFKGDLELSRSAAMDMVRRGKIDPDVALLAGQSVEAGWNGPYAGYILRRPYQGKRPNTTLEFPRSVFDGKAADVAARLGPELYALMVAAEHEFSQKHNVAGKVFTAWVSWKRPGCNEEDTNLNGAFGKHLDYPLAPNMRGTLVVATLSRSAAEQCACDRPT